MNEHGFTCRIESHATWVVEERATVGNLAQESPVLTEELQTMISGVCDHDLRSKTVDVDAPRKGKLPVLLATNPEAEDEDSDGAEDLHTVIVLVGDVNAVEGHVEGDTARTPKLACIPSVAAECERGRAVVVIDKHLMLLPICHVDLK